MQQIHGKACFQYTGKADDTDSQIHNQIHLRVVQTKVRRGKEYCNTAEKNGDAVRQG